ncbi:MULTISPECIES: hypothetical protein [Staphylococcus]|uniref:hypothetical protein n=1 Tax=Staphylococcus TaxID=1279 RepID=UPI0021D28DC0|nr:MULTISPECIES: hypothetical protein [Staphylococcus]UXR32310.1 hypothetical protein MUA81_10485 [Staphylococcus simulans]UXR70293.1 hypothetical protein MUA26_03955 [Staphylococcus sp. IVB6246]UXR74663.1 hypothetical protein MUA48_04215 [Staphylococcus sp. IVB6238]UXR75601.1 hypothetical protein MUA74_07990 [Staphylococcus sp. IVB6233]UXR79801.1 hypothetical protein MUA65_07595 [Staphylococcus sp. IVB6218]
MANRVNVELKSMKKLERELESRYGKAKMKRIVDESLKVGGKVIVENIKRNFEDFKDTGASKAEVKLSAPFTSNGVRIIKIYWKGPKNRWRIIHLNEFGTIKNPNPRGKGAVERAMRSGQEAYVQAIKQRLKRG